MSNLIPDPQEDEKTGFSGFISDLAKAVREAPGGLARTVSSFGGIIPSGVTSVATAQATRGRAIVAPEQSKLGYDPTTGKRVTPTTESIRGASTVAALPLAAAAPLAVPYREVIARPLSTVFLAVNQDYNQDMQEMYGLEGIEIWKQAWQNARIVSPGQSLVGLVGGAIDGEQGTDKINWADETEVRDYFSRGPQKYVSFGIDFTTSAFLDPFYLTGKAAGAARRSIVSQPVTNKNRADLVKQVDAGVAGEQNSVRVIIDTLKANANNPDIINVLKLTASSRESTEITKVLQNAARMAIKTGDDSYIGDVLKLGIGDEKTRTALIEKAPELVRKVDELKGRKTFIEEYMKGQSKNQAESIGDGKFMAPLGVKGQSLLTKMRQKEHAEIAEEVKRANEETDFIYRITSSDEDSIINAFQTQTWSKYAKIESKSIQNSIKFSESYWGMSSSADGVRTLRWFNPSMPLRENPAYIARISGVAADRSSLEARARVAEYGRLAGLSSEAQRALFNTFFTTTNKAERFEWFDKLEDATIVGVIKKHVVKDKPLSADEIKVIEDVALEIAKSSRLRKQNTLVSALESTNYTIADEASGDPLVVEFLKNYVDDIAQEIAASQRKIKPDAADFENARKVAKDLLTNVPTTVSQVPTLHMGMNVQVFDNVIAENADLFQLIIDDIRLNPEDYANKTPQEFIKEALELRASELARNEGAGQLVEQNWLAAKDTASVALENLYSLFWKPSVLLSFKYTSRNVTEGWQRTLAVAIEYARDNGIAFSEVLGGAYEKGIISRQIDNVKNKTKAKEANKVFNAEYRGLNNEAKAKAKELYDLTFTANDSMAANFSNLSKYINLVTSRYGNMLPIDRTPTTDRIIREFSSISQRFDDSTGLYDESLELFEAMASGNLELANSIIISGTSTSKVFKTLEVMQGRIRSQYDEFEKIVNSKEFANEPQGLQNYVLETMDSLKNLDDTVQNIGQIALTRSQINGTINELIVNRTLFNEIKAAGQEEFEVIPGLKMAGYRQGVIGQIMAGEISAAQNSTRTILDSTRLVDSRFLTSSTVEKIIPRTDPEWAKAAADYANRHMTDPVARKFIEDLDIADVVKWARSNDKQAKAWRETKKYDFDRYRASGIKDPLKRIVEETYLMVERVLPKIGNDGSVVRPLTDDAGKLVLDKEGFTIPGLRQLAAEGKLKAEDMLAIPEMQRNDVVGTELLDSLGNKGFLGAWRRGVDKIFKNIATRPEDALVRHPFYNMVYKAEGRRQVKLLQEQGVSVEEIQSRLSEIQINSHKFAYKLLMERLYSIERYTDPAHVMRFVSPFYMAKQNSNRFWFGYALRNPQAASRYFLIYQAPGKVFSVEDENGREVKTVNPFDAQDVNIKVTVPTGVAKFFGADISENAILSTPISSFDLINNGYLPFVPELGGPVIDVTAGKILGTLSGKDYDPELFLAKYGIDPEFLRKKVFPYYKNQEGYSTGDILLSMALQPNSWMRSLASSNIPLVSDVFSVNNPAATEAYNRRVVLAYQDFFAEWEETRYLDNPSSPAPLTDEVRAELLRKSMAAATQMSFAEAIFAGFGFVVAPKFVTKQEELRKDLRLYQQDAVAAGLTEDHGTLQFIKENGFARTAVAQFTPRENNPYGFLSTPQTVNNLQKYSDPFSRAYLELGETKVAGAMLNAGDPVKDYSTVANSKLYSSGASGIGEVKGKLTDPEAAARELEISTGYKYLFAYKDYYDAQVRAGSITQDQADNNYKVAKEALAQRFPAWKSDSGAFDTEKATNNVKAIFKFLEDPAYVKDVASNNPTQQAVYEYMVRRKGLVSERLRIDGNPNADITGTKFKELNVKRDNLVKEIIAKYPEFANFYRYYLENDPLAFDGKIARIK